MSTVTDRTAGIIGDFGIKAPVTVCAVTNIVLSGEQTIDGVATSNTDVLLTNQTTTSENGIYNSDTGTWTRRQDFDGVRDARQGTLIYVTSGTANSGFYYVSTANPVTPDGTMTVSFTKASTVLAVVSAYMQGFLALTTAAAALASLGGATSASPTFTGATTISQSLLTTGVISPTTLTVNTDDYAPTGFSTAAVVRISASGAINLTGIAAGTAGRIIMMHNVGSFAITLKNAATSVPGNQFQLSADYSLAANQSVYLQYDAVSSKWRIFGQQTAAASVATGVNRLTNSGFEIDQRVNSATARSDDTYSLDCWNILTQTAAVNVTQQSDQESGTPFNIRLIQNQASSQRMGVAQYLESADSRDLRTQLATFAARVRISNSQAVRYAILEWTGTADSITSDVVNDWTSGTYTAGNFFLGSNLTVSVVGAITPGAATWTDLPDLSATLSASCNNCIVFIWTEGTAATNVTLDVGRARFNKGGASVVFEQPRYATEFDRAQRYYFKTFAQAVAPAQNIGVVNAFQTTSGNNPTFFTELSFPVVMRASPSVTTFNPSVTNANWRDATNSADRTVAIGESTNRHIAWASTTAAAAALCYIHVTADASL